MSSYKQLFIFVEGVDDERFLEEILKPKFEDKYDLVKLVRYAEIKDEKVNSFIRSVEAMGASYIFMADINDAPCVTAKKQRLKRKYKSLRLDRVIVVIKEIESWYLAGLDVETYKKFGIRYTPQTDSITKEQFNALIPKRFDSRIDFMAEILKVFSIDVAKRRNSSFRYCLKKFDC